jgi:chromosome segregation ATPase
LPNKKKNIAKQSKKGENEGKGIGNYQAKVRYDLRVKEVDGEKRNYELRIDSLEQNIQAQQIRIQNLSQQLEAAMKQVQDLAVKAIEGTSNRQSLEAMKEIALEQAKNAPKSK